MAERLHTDRRPSGISRPNLRLWGYLCLVLGTMGCAVVRNGLLDLPGTSTQELLTAMENEKVFGFITVALVLQAIQCCAAPLFAFLLVEGFRHTESWSKYFLRVLGVAAASEIPFNLAASGRWVDTASRNPVFGLALALLMLYFFQRYGKSRFAGFVLKMVVALAAILWSLMLGIQEGAPLVLLTAVLWLCWEKPVLRMIMGCLAAFACSLFSLFYMLSPIVFILLHFYNGEKGEENVWAKHLAYPVMLLALGLLGKYFL